MADYLGLTVVHVNRVLRCLREAGAISVSRGRMMIRNRQTLERLARAVRDVFDRNAVLIEQEGT
jgi:hypothetical protein